MAKGVRQTGVDWLDIIDLPQAASNVRRDLYGDWYRDPWGWPELAWLTKKPARLAERLSSSGVKKCAPIEVAKENFGTRPGVVMDIVDRLAYQALVDNLSVSLVGDLRQTVFGWRLHPAEPAGGIYADNGIQHEAYRKHTSQFGSHRDLAGLKTDIVSYFANVQIGRLNEQIFARCGNSVVTRRLADLLEGWDSQTNRSGLPQRFHASAVLANVYLQPLDDLILEDLKPPPPVKGPKDIWKWFDRWIRHLEKGQSARWMDDIWIFKSNEGELRAIQVQIQRMLRELGLDMNLAKTDVLSGDPLLEEVLQLQHSAVDEALGEAPANTAPLDELVEQLLEAPERCGRTSFSFVLKRLRDHQHYVSLDDLVGAAERAPHAADHFARLFRDSGKYRELHTWYLGYWRGDWASIDWSVAQLGTMFPQNRVRKRLAERFAETVSTPGGSLAIKALAAQRISATKDPKQWRGALREGLKVSETALERRVLSLAALACREERRFIRSSLSDFEENGMALEMIEDHNFRPFKVPRDFSGV